MRETVLKDPSLAKQAGRFVWLSVDVDKDANAAFITRHPAPAIPTFFIIEPRSEEVVLTRSSGLDRPQLDQLISDGEAACRSPGMNVHSAGMNIHSASAEEAFVEAQRRMGEGDAGAAQAAFSRALETSDRDWPRRRAVVEALLLLEESTGAPEKCAELAAAETEKGPRDAWWANTVATGLGCAEAKSGKAASVLRERAREASKLDGLGADDRSGVYEALVDASGGPGDEEEKKRLAGEWLAFLEKQAAKATTPEARAAFDPHRLEAAMALGDPGRALSALLASERDLPGDHNAPARLAIVYGELGRYDDGLAACERALKLAYGPRRLRVEETRAGLYRKKGDLAGARHALEEAIVAGQALPPSPRATQAVARLKKLLDGIR